MLMIDLTFDERRRLHDAAAWLDVPPERLAEQIFERGLERAERDAEVRGTRWDRQIGYVLEKNAELLRRLARNG